MQVCFKPGLVLWIVVFSLPVNCSSTAFAQSLQWKFSVGDSFTIHIEQTSSVKTIVDRRDVDQGSTMSLDIAWVVESVDSDGNARITQTITGIRAELTMPDKVGSRTINYDSAVEKHTGDARRLADSFSKIVNQPITVVMTTRGEIIDVEIPEETMELIRKMTASMQGRKMLSREALAEMFAQAGTSLPENEVGAGDSWQVVRDFTVGTPAQFEQTTTYTVGEADGAVRPIQFDSELEVKDGGGETRDRESEIEFEAMQIEDQESSGNLVFDLVAGHCRASSSQTMIKTKSQYRDMEVRATINSQVKTSITRD